MYQLFFINKLNRFKSITVVGPTSKHDLNHVNRPYS